MLLIAADLQRPAAVDQLKVLGESVAIDVFSLSLTDTPHTTIEQGLNHARISGYDAVIVDTAGRLAVDDVLMEELSVLNQSFQPHEILLTVDAMSGQDIVGVAKKFKETLPISGLMATKFDSDARGGGVLSVASLTNVPVKFVGVGEKIDELELFYPDRMANRILGMGDVVSLVEKAQETIDTKKSMSSMQRMMQGTFTLDDMLEQIEQMNKMGSLKGVLKMLPNSKQLMNQIDDDVAAKSMKTSKSIILSMTKDERNDPSILKASRKHRIAKGSGVTITQVNQLLSQFEKTKQQMQMMLKQANPNAGMMSSGSNTKKNPNKKKKKKKR